MSPVLKTYFQMCCLFANGREERSVGILKLGHEINCYRSKVIGIVKIIFVMKEREREISNTDGVTHTRLVMKLSKLASKKKEKEKN